MKTVETFRGSELTAANNVEQCFNVANDLIGNYQHENDSFQPSSGSEELNKDLYRSNSLLTIHHSDEDSDSSHRSDSIEESYSDSALSGRSKKNITVLLPFNHQVSFGFRKLN